MKQHEIIFKDSHRGLWYEDGVLKDVVGAGRYKIPLQFNFGFWRRPGVEIVLIDVRQRELTIRGQEILTSDKVAIRVSIIVQFQVVDPKAAIHTVDNYEERLYSDVQLAARHSLASMTLDEILTNRNRLSEDILGDIKEAAVGYGVKIIRADVKDLVFPGNLQEVMNRVLVAERMSQAQLVEARTRGEVQRIDAQAKAEVFRKEAEALAEADKLKALAGAETRSIESKAETAALHERAQAAEAYNKHPALLRLKELEAMGELAKLANARIYIGFDKHLSNHAENEHC